MQNKEKILISPNGAIACHIKRIEEINKAAFGAKAFFLNYKGQKLYDVGKEYLHELPVKNASDCQIEDGFDSNYKFLQWSEDGGGVYFLEYQIRKGHFYYVSTIIDFANNQVYRIDENDEKSKQIDTLSISEKPFDMNYIRNKLGDVAD